MLAAFAMVAGCSGKDSSTGSGDPLRVGMDLSYPPFEMQNKFGQPDGVGVRLAEALAKDLGRPLKIVPMDFSGLIPALKTGNIDLIISSMTATDERR
jgi:polar amino acid transport system substrate-binding protein